MKTKLLSCLVSLAVWVIGANAAQATMVAGWDFSQYPIDGALFDGANFINTLGANYTDLTAPGGNVPGPAAAVFGTMYLDGQFGSINTPLDGTDRFVPSAAAPFSLSSNLDAPAGPDFNSFAILTTNGQTAATSDFTMTALSTVTVVFGADLGTSQGNTWSISFGGKTNTGSSSVEISFSTDGTTFTPVSPVNLTAVDTPFNVALGGAQSSTAYVRLSFNPGASQQTFIDNFAFNAAEVSVPEPATAVLLLTGLAGLARAGRRRA